MEHIAAPASSRYWAAAAPQWADAAEHIAAPGPELVIPYACLPVAVAVVVVAAAEPRQVDAEERMAAPGPVPVIAFSNLPAAAAPKRVDAVEHTAVLEPASAIALAHSPVAVVEAAAAKWAGAASHTAIPAPQ